MFWKRSSKENEGKIYEKILQLVSIMQTQIKSIEADVELLNAKFKKKVYDQLLPESEREKEVGLSPQINDGFNSLRKHNMEHGTKDYLRL